MVWAKELSKYDIRSVALAPGFIDSPLTRHIPKEVRSAVIDKQISISSPDISVAFEYISRAGGAAVIIVTISTYQGIISIDTNRAAEIVKYACPCACAAGGACPAFRAFQLSMLFQPAVNSWVLG